MFTQVKGLIFIPLLFRVFTLEAQDATEKNLKAEVYYLADDRLEGRATASNGEKMAGDYISAKFKEAGLTALGDQGTYLQSFDVNFGKEPGANNYIKIEGAAPDEACHFFSDCTVKIYPLNFSANGIAKGDRVFCGYGIIAPELNYDDYKGIDVKGKIAIIKVSTPEGDSPHSKYFNYIDERDKANIAIKRGAAGIIFINDDPDYPDIDPEYNRTITPVEVPVIYYAKSFVPQFNKVTDIEIGVELNSIIKPAHNVIGYIDNHAQNTIVIGAHYDHLGHGEIEGSLYRGTPAIHNGADDNASGVSLIIELANKLKASTLKNNNYLIVAFSGEEMGLFGSKALVGSELFKQFNINYMLNFDMVGRMDSVNDLLINGVGTSPAWKSVDSMFIDGIKIKTSESGVGPSDQTSFYLKDIPVLFFFTGSHSDYHKPSDDADKINYAGIEKVMDYSFEVIKVLNTQGKLAFTKTKDDSNDDLPKFTVTLGLIPDYAFTGKGMRIDGISDGKAAQKAGLLAGDIITDLGANEVTDLTSYMKALSKFKKGDKTTVTVLRNNAPVTVPVEF